MPLSGFEAPHIGVNDAAAVWRTCRTIILAGWAALGCDVGATSDRKGVGPRGQMSKVLWGPRWPQKGREGIC